MSEMPRSTVRVPSRRQRISALTLAAIAAVAVGSSALSFLAAPSAPQVQSSLGHLVGGAPRASNRASTARSAYVSAKVATPPEDLMTAKQWEVIPSAEKLEYAVVEFGGRQHMVTEGSAYESSFIRAVPGSKVRFNRVLLLKQDDGQGDFDVTIGQPFVDGAYVDITILEHLKGPDQVVYKHKPKKHYQKRWIVQQSLTRFRIDKIGWDKQ
mmetsp:Transcript_31608/g.73723  ORF Transcript_31608/g.73723 Transcript_31608/m.73723 type:complete len:211 (-) Transcript_31608:82-714(-)